MTATENRSSGCAHLTTSGGNNLCESRQAGRISGRGAAWLRYYVILSPRYSRGPRIMAATIYKAVGDSILETQETGARTMLNNGVCRPAITSTHPPAPAPGTRHPAPAASFNFQWFTYQRGIDIAQRVRGLKQQQTPAKGLIVSVRVPCRWGSS